MEKPHKISSKIYPFEKLLAIVELTGVLVFAILLHPYSNGKTKLASYLHCIMYGNIIKVNVHDGLDLNKVKVIYKDETQIELDNRHSIDTYISTRIAKKVVIFEHGTLVNDIPYEYGKQVLQVFYDGIDIGSIGHWQTNSYHTHRYYIDVYRNQNRVYLQSKITGPDVRDWMK